MKYQKTIQLNNSSVLDSIKPGQWVQLPSGERGQFLGVTRTRVEVIQYHRPGVKAYLRGWNSHLITLRKIAKEYGAK